MDTSRETEQERSDAWRWILGAGGAALALAFFANRVDRYMENAPARDRGHAEMMRELRTAQTSLPSRVTDDRLKVRIPTDATRWSVQGADKSSHEEPSSHEAAAGHEGGEHEDHDH